MDFKSLLNKLDSMEAPLQTPAAPTIAKAVQLNEDAQLRVLSGRTSYIEEAEKQGAKEKSSTGGTTDRSKPGVTTHTQDPDRDNAAPDSHAELASNARSQSAAEKKAQAPKLTRSKTGTWGMEGGKKFDNTEESIEPQFKSKFMKMVEAAKEQSKAEKERIANEKLKDKKEKMAKIMDESVEEGEKKCPPMSQIKKMCEKKMSVAEICKKHPDCNQKELKQMIADCKKTLDESKGDGNLANNAKPYKIVTQADVVTGRLGKDEKGGKDKKGMSAAQAKYFGKKDVKEGSRASTGSARDKLIGSISSRMKDTPQPQRAPKDQEEADSWARMKRDQEGIANRGKKKDESKMMPKGKKRPVKESVENILSFKDMIKLVQESGGQQQIDAVDQELFSWAQRVAKQKIGEGLKADVYAGMVYERMGGVFEMYDVLSEDQR